MNTGLRLLPTYLVDSLAASAGRVVLPNVGLNELILLIFNQLKHLRIIMEDVADQTVSCIRDPVTEIISSAGDIDRYLPLGAIQPKGLNCPVTSSLYSCQEK